MRRAVAVTVWATTAAMDIAMFWTLTAGGFLQAMATDQGPTGISVEMLVLTYAAVGSIVAVTLSYASVGVLLATRPGAGRLSAVLLAGGLVFAAIPFGYVVGGTLVLRDPYDTFANAVFLIGPASIALGYSLILPVLALVFPHGTLPSRRWRVPVGLVAASLLSSTVLTVLRPGEIADTTSRNPFGIGAMPTMLDDVATVLSGLGIVAISLLGAAAVVIRYRRGALIERQQLRWFLGAVMLAVVPLAISPQPSIGGPFWVLAAAVGLLLVPVSVGIAVARYRLYEIDRLISRTIGWALVTGVLLTVFVVVVVGLQAALASLTQGDTLAVAASTLVAFALFQPVRRRVQRAVDRRFDRARYDGERTAAAFAERLRDQVDLLELEGDIAATVAAALRPSSTELWIRGRQA